MENHRKDYKHKKSRKPGRPKGTGGAARELFPQEIKRIIKCLAGTRYEHRNKTMILFGLGTGMRISEICGLKVSDIFPFGEVLPTVILEKHKTKSRKSREVFISEQAQLEVRRWLLNHHPQKDQDKEAFLGAPLFPSGKGGGLCHLTPANASTSMVKIFTDAGVSGAKSHSLRRTHAQALRRNGVDMKIIQEQLGHSSLAITGRYLGAGGEEKAKAVGGLKF